MQNCSSSWRLKGFSVLLLYVFFTYSENLIMLSFFKIDLWQHQQKKLVSKKVDLAHLDFIENENFIDKFSFNINKNDVWFVKISLLITRNFFHKSCMAGLQVILVFMQRKSHGLIKSGLIYYCEFAMSVPNHLHLLRKQRLYWA